MRTGSVYAGLNCTAQWLKGNHAGNVRTPDLRHTIVGFATNVAAIILCAGLFPDLAARCGLATNRIITAVVGLAAQCLRNSDQRQTFPWRFACVRRQKHVQIAAPGTDLGLRLSLPPVTKLRRLRPCRDCMKLRCPRDSRTRKIQTVFGTITVDAPRFSVCPCQNDRCFVDVSVSPLATLRQAVRDQGWQPGHAVTVLSDGEAALPGLVRAAVAERTTCILDW